MAASDYAQMQSANRLGNGPGTVPAFQSITGSTASLIAQSNDRLAAVLERLRGPHPTAMKAESARNGPPVLSDQLKELGEQANVTLNLIGELEGFI